MFFHVAGFLHGIFAEGGTRLGDVNIAADVFQALDFVLAAKDGSYLFQLVGVVAGKN